MKRYHWLKNGEELRNSSKLLIAKKLHYINFIANAEVDLPSSTTSDNFVLPSFETASERHTNVENTEEKN